ncbi:MAG: hypothetical protein KKG47_03035 [Proteobacteria bacterium]|nr:hypothetical protein [Pseudomonadota bacterium]MBU1738868.1 hypothetical protein [Pseudomonadota bacterium]
MKKLSLLILPILLSLLISAEATADAPAGQDETEKVFIVSGYRYEPGGDVKQTDVGQSLCGTRCNALSVDYLNYTEPGGWRMIKVADKRELTVDLNNPFLAGECICVADEYIVKVNELYLSSKTPRGKEVR